MCIQLTNFKPYTHLLKFSECFLCLNPTIKKDSPKTPNEHGCMKYVEVSVYWFVAVCV